MTKIDIISGFLGAGKTTLIKKLIEEAFEGEKLMLIENEFGEIGIDGGFLNNSGVEITEMNSGCICCSLVGDFGTALKEALSKYSPDRIIIEPSGVGKLSDVIKAVENIKHEVDITLNSATTVVDAMKCKMYMNNFGEFFNNQIESANTIILSRSQKLSEEKLEVCVSQIREYNSNATIITTNWDEIHGNQIILAMEEKNSLEKELLSEEKEHHEHHHHDSECCCEHDHKDEECPEHEHNHHESECCCEHDHKDEECPEHEHNHHESECCCEHDHKDEECHEHEHNHHESECCCGHDHKEEECNEHEHNHHDSECCCGHDHKEEECNEHEHEHDHHDHECTCGHDHHKEHHHADDVFTSWGTETPKKYSKSEINNILNTLAESSDYGIILRAKGIVPCQDGGWINFDLVPGEYEVRAGVADYTGRLCVIGTNLNKNKIEKLFRI